MAAPSHPIQSTSLPTAITGVLPNLKPPDPNNIFDQLKFYQGAAERLMQNIATQSNPGSSQQHAASPDLKSLGPGQLNKPERVTRTKPTNTLPIRGQNQPHRPPVRLSTIPAPHRGDKRPLIVLMGLKGRFNVYRRIRSRIWKIAHNSGIDWTKPWPQVPASEKAMFYQMVRHQVPYMERFDMDWASGKIMAKYATHLRREARHNGELPPDPRYAYLKANSAKRRKDAPRGVRPGIAKDRDQAGPSNDNYDTGPSEASPSSSSVNTAQDEAMMDTPGLFGLEDLHNEGKSGEDFNDGDNENDDDDGNDDGDGDF